MSAAAVLAATAPGASDPLAVPRESVDALIKADFAASSLSYTIYIANLPPPAAGRPYSYSPVEADGPCLSCQWPAQGARFTFIDVGAQCGRIGPVGAGGGVSRSARLSFCGHSLAVSIEMAAEGRAGCAAG